MNDAQDARPALDPTALPLAAAAKLLSRASGTEISVQRLQADVQAGAPTNADGTLNLVHYGAWVLQEMGRGD